MSTIVMDSQLYSNATEYARRHRTSLRYIIESYITKLTSEDKDDIEEGTTYYISPAVKSLESGFKAPNGLSEDYKKEISKQLDHKYL